MTQTEQKEFDQLRNQLASAEQIKACFSSSMDRLSNEVRLYRGLFWSLLAVATVVAILSLLQR